MAKVSASESSDNLLVIQNVVANGHEKFGVLFNIRNGWLGVIIIMIDNGSLKYFIVIG